MRKMKTFITLLIVLTFGLFYANQNSDAAPRKSTTKSVKSMSATSTNSSSAGAKDADQAEMDKMVMAIQAGDIDKVKAILSKSPNLINQKDDPRTSSGQRDARPTLIISHAIISGQKEIALFLLSKGANIMAPINENGPPILFGLVLKNFDMLNYFITNGVNIKQTDKYMNSAMHYLRELDTNTVNLLIANGCDVNAKNKYNMTPLHMIAEYGYSQRDAVAKILIINGADVNAKDKNGNTPLLLVALSGSMQGRDMGLAIYLIEKGADINAKTKDGLTPLHMAAGYSGNKNWAIYLIEKGADINAKDIHGNTPYSLAIKKRNLEMVKLLEEKGAK